MKNACCFLGLCTSLFWSWPLDAGNSNFSQDFPLQIAKDDDTEKTKGKVIKRVRRRRVISKKVSSKGIGLGLDSGGQWYFPLDSSLSSASGFFVLPGVYWVFRDQGPYRAYVKFFGHYISNSTPISKLSPASEVQVSTAITKFALGSAFGMMYKLPKQPYLFDADLAYSYGISGNYLIRLIGENQPELAPLALHNAHAFGSTVRAFYVFTESVRLGASLGLYYSYLKRLSLRDITQLESFSYLDFMLGLSSQFEL